MTHVHDTAWGVAVRAAAERGLDDDVVAGHTRAALPFAGRSRAEIMGALGDAKEGDYPWRAGTLPLYVYWHSEDVYDVALEAYLAYFTENGMGRRAFPSVAQLERDVLDFVLDLMQAPPTAAASFTTGGTESILLAVKTARDHARATGRVHPSVRGRIVVPITAHPAFSKAAHFLDLDEVRVPLGAELRVDSGRLEAEIDSRTIMIAGSAPNFPHGLYDDIAILGQIAAAAGVWLHVDACVGGMLAPFVKSLGRHVPEYDFTVAGVSSISVDLHKYGYSAKGASTLLLRDGDMQRFLRFEFDNWPRGHYSTDTILGTRPAGPIASAWAVMNFLGHQGYREGARIILEAKDELIAGIAEIGGLCIIEPHELSFLLFTSDSLEVDINAVAEQMSRRGWFVGRSLDPPAIHLMLNPIHRPVIKRYLDDLAEVVTDVRARKLTGQADAHTY